MGTHARSNIIRCTCKEVIIIIMMVGNDNNNNALEMVKQRTFWLSTPSSRLTLSICYAFTMHSNHSKYINMYIYCSIKCHLSTIFEKYMHARVRVHSLVRLPFYRRTKKKEECCIMIFKVAFGDFNQVVHTFNLC